MGQIRLGLTRDAARQSAVVIIVGSLADRTDLLAFTSKLMDTNLITLWWWGRRLRICCLMLTLQAGSLGHLCHELCHVPACTGKSMYRTKEVGDGRLLSAPPKADACACGGARNHPTTHETNHTHTHRHTPIVDAPLRHRCGESRGGGRHGREPDHVRRLVVGLASSIGEIELHQTHTHIHTHTTHTSGALSVLKRRSQSPPRTVLALAAASRVRHGWASDSFLGT